VGGKIAYCPQVPWIVSDTVKGNITMEWGLDDNDDGSKGKINEDKYMEAVRVCALRPDLAILPAGMNKEYIYIKILSYLYIIKIMNMNKI
jgi:hypothetical protein